MWPVVLIKGTCKRSESIRRRLRAISHGRLDAFVTGVLIKSVQTWRQRLSFGEKRLLQSMLSEVKTLDCDDLNILIHVDSLTEMNSRARSCSKEPFTIRWLQSNLRPGDVFYDVGANIGAYSLVAAKLVERVTVYAFEPSFQNYYQLCRNVLLNDCQDIVVPLLIPVCDRTRLDKFHYHGLETGGALHAFAKAIDYKAEAFLPVASLWTLGLSMDDFMALPGAASPNLLKIDVDGLEAEILAGAQKALQCDKLRSILVEVNEDLAKEVKKIMHILFERGFEPLEKHQLQGGLHNVVFIRGISRIAPREISEVRVAYKRG